MEPRSATARTARALLMPRAVSRVLTTNELVTGDNCYFAATGITDGDLLRGVRYQGDKVTTQSIVMRSKSGTVRIIDAEHQARKWESYTRQ